MPNEDEQIRLLTEIRNNTREHLELYRQKSTAAINTQKRAVAIWLVVVLAAVLGGGALFFKLFQFIGDQSEDRVQNRARMEEWLRNNPPESGSTAIERPNA